MVLQPCVHKCRYIQVPIEPRSHRAAKRFCLFRKKHLQNVTRISVNFHSSIQLENQFICVCSVPGTCIPGCKKNAEWDQRINKVQSENSSWQTRFPGFSKCFFLPQLLVLDRTSGREFLSFQKFIFLKYNLQEVR